MMFWGLLLGLSNRENENQTIPDEGTVSEVKDAFCAEDVKVVLNKINDDYTEDVGNQTPSEEEGD